MRQPTVFLSCEFRSIAMNAANVVLEVAREFGVTVVDGRPPHTGAPERVVRQRMAASDAFIGIITDWKNTSFPSPWISNEIGMAHAFGLPMIICKEESVEEIGLAKLAVGYLKFDQNEIHDFTAQLRRAFRTQLLPELRRAGQPSIARLVGSIMDAAIAGSGERVEGVAPIGELSSLLDEVVEEYELHRFSIGESDEFAQKRLQNLRSKSAIATFVVNNLVAHQREDELVFMDSGTTTYAICEEIVERAAPMPVITNNLPSLRMLAQIPNYPVFVVPGKLDSHHVAAVGTEAVNYLRPLLTRQETHLMPITTSVVAATSMTAAEGPCGHDPDHGELKKTLLESSEQAILVFSGEKLFERLGGPILGSKSEWTSLAKRRSDGSLQIVTHVPENWDTIHDRKRKLFDAEIDRLESLVGDDHVIVLGTK